MGVLFQEEEKEIDILKTIYKCRVWVWKNKFWKVSSSDRSENTDLTECVGSDGEKEEEYNKMAKNGIKGMFEWKVQN